MLLDREAPEGFGWWRELTGSGLNTARERRDLMYASRPTQLPDLSDLKERRELMQAALTAGWELRKNPLGVRKFLRQAWTQILTLASANRYSATRWRWSWRA